MVALLVSCLISALLLAAGHWFNWRLVFGSEMPRLWAYIYGVAAIVLPAAGLMVVWEMRPAALALAAISASAGVTVVGAYLLDNWLLLRMRDRERKEQDALEGPTQPGRG
jgi:hypothetical protein